MVERTVLVDANTQRKCCKCRSLFTPDSPYFFKCNGCKENEHDQHMSVDGRGLGGTPLEWQPPIIEHGMASKVSKS